MGKKRKGGKHPSSNEEADSTAKGSAQLTINTFEDVADSEDEFHVNRDKILLEEGPVQKKRRQIQEEEHLLGPSDEEVLSIDEEVWSSSGKDDEEDTEEELAPQTDDKLTKGGKDPLQDSDEEDIGTVRQDEGEKGWGSSKKDYYDADVIETEADALEEEAEARRLQQSQLQDMTAADFGFDEAQWLEVDKEEEADSAKDGVRREVLPKIEITDAVGPHERINIMQTRYPEFEPLAREFLDLQVDYDELATKVKKAADMTMFNHSRDDPTSEAQGHLQRSESLVNLKYRALSAYLGALSMYFALFTSGSKLPDGKTEVMAPENLREHAIMETLVQCRDLWERIKEIPLPEVNSEERAIDATIDPPATDLKESMPSPLNSSNGHSSIHLNPYSSEQLSKHQKKRIRKAERLALAAQEEALMRQRERLRETELSLESLPDFMKNSATATASLATKPNSATNEDDNSDFGDATSLTAYELAEKAKRKKSLKFYTSQIAQKSNKRDGAGRDAGGDTDLPYRERLRDRQERLKAEAERRGEKAKLSSVGAPLGQGASDEEAELTNGQRRQNDDAADSDNYYNQIVKRASDKKASKAANAKAYEAAINGSLTAALDEHDDLDARGKRAITYAIEKNKGLHPHRKKDVRNPRVKKRKKYEDKQKKLKSMRAVYKPEREGPGGYGGEKTGIKRNLVKSVKL